MDNVSQQEIVQDIMVLFWRIVGTEQEIFMNCIVIGEARTNLLCWSVRTGTCAFITEMCPSYFMNKTSTILGNIIEEKTLEELRLKKECQTLYVPFVLKSFRLGQKEFNCPAHVVMFTTKIALWGGWIVPTLAPCVVGLSLKDFIWILIPCNHDFHAFTQNLHYKDLNIWS